MAATLKFIYGTEAQILSLTPESPKWVEQAFYYPVDTDYFYQALNGVMKQYGGGSLAGVGVKLNGIVMGGTKRLIELNELLTIPVNYDYNTYTFEVDGIINCDGQINVN